MATRFPSDRFVYVYAPDRSLRSAAGTILYVFEDVEGLIPALITDLDGVPIAGSRLVVDTDSRMPEFLSTEDRMSLYVRSASSTQTKEILPALPDLVDDAVGDNIQGYISDYLDANPIPPSSDEGNLLGSGTDGLIFLSPQALPPVAVDDVEGLGEALGEKADVDDPRLSDARTPLAHTHTTADVVGLSGALAAKVDGDDPRLSDSRTPLAHDHVMADVVGLSGALAAKADLVAGKVPASQIPDIAIVDYLGAVGNQAAMLALTGQKGDWCTRTDLGSTWVITGDSPATIGSWTALSYPASPVVSVAGRTGAVTLSKGDVGLANVDNTSDLSKPISTATQAALNDKADSASLATVATTGSYDDLEDLPDISSIAANTAARHTHSNKAILDSTEEAFTTALKNKVDGIEAGADVTDATNVQSAGAVMTSGNQAIAGTKTFSTVPVLPGSDPTTANQATRKSYVDSQVATRAASSHTHSISNVTGLQDALDDKVDADTLVSADLDNAAGLGSDGGVYVAASQPPGDYIEASDLASLLKYAAPFWVLEADEDETDLPADFPTAPFFPGGPPPIVTRKKPEA